MNKIFPYDENVNILYNQAKRLFHASMNGIASKKMETLKYKVVFGVDLPRIKEISSRFSYNHLLAQRAWWSEIREMMIFSTLILGRYAEENARKSQWGKSELEEWTNELFNIELCEQLSKNFLCKLDESESFCFNLLENKERTEYQVALSYITFGNMILTKRKINNVEKLTKFIEKDILNDLYNISTSAGRCLKLLVRVDAKSAENIMKQIRTVEPESGIDNEQKQSIISRILEEVQTELTYYEA